MVGGETPGDPRFEILRDPLAELLVDARAFAAGLLAAQAGPSVDETFPYFDEGLRQAAARTSPNGARRSKMPVISEEDLSDLKIALSSHNLSDWCDVCTIQPWEAIPSQSQIYADKSIQGTVDHGRIGTLQFLRSNHLVVSEDNQIIDGHHRWLSSFLLAPNMQLPAFRIKAPLNSLLDLLVGFSDARHQRNQ